MAMKRYVSSLTRLCEPTGAKVARCVGIDGSPSHGGTEFESWALKLGAPGGSGVVIIVLGVARIVDAMLSVLVIGVDASLEDDPYGDIRRWRSEVGVAGSVHTRGCAVALRTGACRVLLLLRAIP